MIQGIQVPYKSLEESLAIAALRRQERINLLNTIAVVTAQVNPEKAQEALRRLCEEMFPEIKRDREKFVERAMDMMDKETKKVYSVQAVGDSLKKTPFGRLRDILKGKATRGLRG